MLKKIESLANYESLFPQLANDLILKYVTQENYDEYKTFTYTDEDSNISYRAFGVTDHLDNVKLFLHYDGIQYFILRLTVSEDEEGQHKFIYKFLGSESHLTKNIPQDLLIDLGAEGEIPNQ